jgi:hypothetical protein
MSTCTHELRLPPLPIAAHAAVALRWMHGSTLVPAAALFAKQSNAHIEVRSAPNFHDRYLIVDATACFQSGPLLRTAAERLQQP